MSLEKFNQLKTEFNEQEQQVIKIQGDLAKNGNILEALQNELNEIVQRQKIKLEETGDLSADEYVELKQQDAGYKARIEYYQALNVELETQLYNAKEALYLRQKTLQGIRGEYLYQKANELLAQVFQEKHAEFTKIYGYLIQSDQLKSQINYTDDTHEKAVIRYLQNKFISMIDTSGKIESELNLNSEILVNFQPKSPAAKHKEKTETQPKGFAALIHNLQKGVH